MVEAHRATRTVNCGRVRTEPDRCQRVQQWNWAGSRIDRGVRADLALGRYRALGRFGAEVEPRVPQRYCLAVEPAVNDALGVASRRGGIVGVEPRGAGLDELRALRIGAATRG